MKHETGAQASAPEPHNTSHTPTPERKEERPAMTDDKDVSSPAERPLDQTTGDAVLQAARWIVSEMPNHTQSHTVARAYIELARRAARMEFALAKAVGKFQQYGTEHRVKAAVAKFNGLVAAEMASVEKAITNETMADLCALVLADAPVGSSAPISAGSIANGED